MIADIIQMRREISAVPASVEHLLNSGGNAIASTAAQARDVSPPFLLSVARESSDHACICLKCASELVLKRPSVASQYGIDPDTSWHLNKVTETT